MIVARRIVPARLRVPENQQRLHPCDFGNANGAVRSNELYLESFDVSDALALKLPEGNSDSRSALSTVSRRHVCRPSDMNFNGRLHAPPSVSRRNEAVYETWRIQWASAVCFAWSFFRLGSLAMLMWAVFSFFSVCLARLLACPTE